jgi:hypothetical protein
MVIARRQRKTPTRHVRKNFLFFLFFFPPFIPFGWLAGPDLARQLSLRA